MASCNEISVKTLSRLIGIAGHPVRRDLHTNPDFKQDPDPIPGAHRDPFTQVAELANDLRGKKVVVYCQRGLKIHRDALSRLALIVRWADTNGHDLAPEVAGLVAVSIGLSRM